MEAANSQSKFRTMNGQKNRICRGPPEADEWKRVTLDCKLSDMGSINTSAFGLIVVCFGRFWVRDLSFPNARHLGHPFQWKNTLPWHLGPRRQSQNPPLQRCFAVPALPWPSKPRLRYSPGLAPTTLLNALLNAASDS